jgi:hypothetical protein
MDYNVFEGSHHMRSYFDRHRHLHHSVFVFKILEEEETNLCQRVYEKQEFDHDAANVDDVYNIGFIRSCVL